MRCSILVMLATACGGPGGAKSEGDLEGDADTDSDADTDTDSDADTDTDTDADADTDSHTGVRPTGDTGGPITDLDGDGHDALGFGGDDCDDADATVHPGAAAVCDGRDNDCDPATWETHSVDLDGAPVPTLAAAFAGASDGSTVTLCEGLYREVDLYLATSITLVGAGSAATVIDGGGSRSALRILGSASIRGITVTNGVGSPGRDGTEGGGLWIRGQVGLEDVVVAGNAARSGAGVFLDSRSTLDLTDSSVVDNEAALSGGGLYVGGDATVTLTRSHVDRNSSHSSGGAYLGTGCQILGDGASTVSGNEALIAAAGGISSQGDVTLRGFELAENSSPSIGGGLYLQAGGTLEALVVRDNTAGQRGGGGRLMGDFRVVECTFADNSAGDGGALDHLYHPSSASTSDLLLTRCTFTGNVATAPTSAAGGVYLDGLDPTRLVSQDTDWGPAGSNRPVDGAIVGVATVPWDVTGVATFVCDSSSATCQ